MKSKYSISSLMVGLAILLFISGVPDRQAAAASSSTSWAGEMAIRGYDPVSYFRAGKPMKGERSISFRWHGLTWYFSSAENRRLFTADPKKYAPQYDGYCAWAMSEARIAVTDPEAWKIVDGKLYLNCSRAAFAKWARDIPGNIKKADENWKRIRGNK
jgi:YHS domain-containing protein